MFVYLMLGWVGEGGDEEETEETLMKVSRAIGSNSVEEDILNL